MSDLVAYPEAIDVYDIDEVIETLCSGFSAAYPYASYHFAHAVINNENYDLPNIQSCIDHIDDGYARVVEMYGERQASVIKDAALHLLSLLETIVTGHDEAFEYYLEGESATAENKPQRPSARAFDRRVGRVGYTSPYSDDDTPIYKTLRSIDIGGITRVTIIIDAYWSAIDRCWTSRLRAVYSNGEEELLSSTSSVSSRQRVYDATKEQWQKDEEWIQQKVTDRLFKMHADANNGN